MRAAQTHSLGWRHGAIALALVLGTLSTAFAQSSELDQPTPIATNEVAGRIAPRDLGDARQTSHYYTFNGTQGDLLLTIESDNLDGVVDLFLTPGLRPLTQITLFAGSALNVSKTVFLRKDETLILRVQARTPNDTDGTYRIRLGGSFLPAVNTAASSEPETTAANKPSARPPGRGGHRVNAVGARIDEPEVEAPKTEAAEAPQETPTPARDTATTPRATTSRTNPPRRTRTPTRTETARRPAPKPERKTEIGAEPKPGETETARTETAEPTPVKPEPARTRTSRTPRTGRTKAATKRSNESTKEAAPATAPAEAAQSEPTSVPQLGATHLIIENKDGTKIEHDMSTVKSVTVVSQLLVVVLKSGRIERYPMTNLLRMAIEP
ncbi:MAG: hypothetical protein ACJ74W_09775 [Pyrinomonadaceae bacterium]